MDKQLLNCKRKKQMPWDYQPPAKERLEIAYYLTSIAYKFDMDIRQE